MFDEVRSSRLYGPIRPELAVAPWPYPFWGEAVTHTSGVTPCGRRAMVGPSTGCRHSSRQSVYRDIGTPLKRLLNRERHRLVHVVLPQLIEKHRFVLVQHFWHGRYLKDIGRDLGVTEGRACQLKREALHAFLARWPLPK